MRRLKPIIIVIFFVLIAFILSLPLKNIQLSNEHWLPESNKLHQNKIKLNHIFTSGEDINIIFFLNTSFFNEHIIRDIHEIKEQLSTLPFIQNIRSPLHSQYTFEDKDNILHLISFHEALNKGLIADYEDYEKLIKQSIYHKELLSEDARILVMNSTLVLDPTKDNSQLRKTTVEQIESILIPYHDIGHYEITGETGLIHLLDTESRSDITKLPLISSILILISMYLLFKNKFVALIISFIAMLCTLINLNVMNFFKHEINAVTLCLPVLIIGIVIADAIHILTYYTRLHTTSLTNQEKLLKTFKHMWVPCLLTTVTTGTGFGVFYFSEILPLQHLGWDSLITLILCYPVILGSCLLMLSLIPSMKLEPKLTLGRQRLIQLSEQLQLKNHNKSILYIALLLLILSCLSLQFIRTESNFLDVFFKKTHPIHETFNTIDNSLTGTGVIEVLFTNQSPDHFKEYHYFEALNKASAELEKHPLITSTYSYTNSVGIIHKGFNQLSEFPTNQDALSQELLFLEWSRNEEDPDILSPFLNFDASSTRLSIKTLQLSSQETQTLLKETIRPTLNQYFDIPFNLSGFTYYFQQMSAYIIDTQLISLFGCTFIVWLIFLIKFGWYLGNIAILTNLLPTLCTLGTITTLGIPFDFATVLIASVSLGLCVDHTIHFLHTFSDYQSKQKYTISQSIQYTLQDTFFYSLNHMAFNTSL